MNPSRSVSPTRAHLVVYLIVLTLLAALAPRAFAADPTFPALTGRLVDDARVILPESEPAIEAKLAQLEAETGDQFVVVTVPSLQGYEIEDFGYRLGRHWGIGQSENDSGVLLIVAPNERKVRLEVGYGLEPVLTDALSNHIIQTQILPAFREGGYVRGVNNGVDAVIAQLKLDPVEAQARAAEVVHEGAEPPIFPGVVIALIFIFFFLSMLSRSGRRSRSGRGGGRGNGGVSPILVWGASEILSQAVRNSSRGSRGGGFGGGFGGGGGFSGGGGSFGGGGASGGW